MCASISLPPRTRHPQIVEDPFIQYAFRMSSERHQMKTQELQKNTPSFFSSLLNFFRSWGVTNLMVGMFFIVAFCTIVLYLDKEKGARETEKKMRNEHIAHMQGLRWGMPADQLRMGTIE